MGYEIVCADVLACAAEYAGKSKGEAMLPPDDCPMDVGCCEDCELMAQCWGLDEDAWNQELSDEQIANTEYFEADEHESW